MVVFARRWWSSATKLFRCQANEALGLSGRGDDPIKGQDAKELGSGRFSVPAAVWIQARDFFASEHFHGFDFREGRPGALPLQVDIMAASWALENDSIGFDHGS
jgi:hypothetical protein